MSDSPGIPNVLTIAGSDPSGGAGIQADLKTFAAMGVYGCAALTMLTAQNSRTIAGAFALSRDFVALQLETLFEDIDIHAVKVGALGGAGAAHAVAATLERKAERRLVNLVIDPVLQASNGGELLDTEGAHMLRDRLFPLATVVTPNAIEAGVLLGIATPATASEMATAAHALKQLGPAWVVVTGGHVEHGGECIDVVTDGDVLYELCVPRVAGPPTHGTGCTLSSAIAAFLALGCDVPDACLNAQQYVAAAIAAAPELAVGGGRAPLHHIPLARAAAALAQGGVG